MTWKYSDELRTNRDKVRFLSGDTDTSNQIFSDEEIEGALDLVSDDVYEAAAICCDSIAAKYSRSQTIKIDGFSINYAERATHFRDQARRIRVAAQNRSGQLGVPIIDGVSVSEKDAVRDDEDRVPSRFEMSTHDTPGTSYTEGDEDITPE